MPPNRQVELSLTLHLVSKWKNGGYPFWVWLNRTDSRINLAMLNSLSRPCTESLYTRMSELWPCASLHLPERGKGEKAANKQKRVLEFLFLASPSYSFWSSCAKNVKNSECPLFTYLSVKYFFFPPGSDGNQCLMTHLRYSKTTRRERESKRSKKRRRRWVCVSMSFPPCMCLTATSFCVCVCACLLTTHSQKMVQMSMLRLLSHTVRHASKRRDFPSLFQISQAVQMGTDMLPK